MPGKIKVKVLAGRNLPVMDRAGDTTDAFVEIKFGGVTHKTDVCRKSLNPHWSSTEWYRFEVDESELQDEPLQLRLMDHDTYSANDAIGKVVISLAPLLAREAINAKSGTGPPGGAVLSGWIPVFDTMHGIRGELNVIVKVELFSDFNKYKTSSCGVQFFHCPSIPPNYKVTAIHGFVEELVVNDDPEYQWIDKIRTPRASNEARQVAFIKLSNQVQRLVGVKAAELGANAVVGYQQDFDLEGEAGVVARAIGTAVSVTPVPTPYQTFNIPAYTQQQLKKYLDILATDGESITDLNEYFQSHQEELQKLLSIMNPKTPALLDDAENNDDDEKCLTRRSSFKSFGGGGNMSIYEHEYVSQKSLKNISEDQTDLNKLLKRSEDSDSDSTGPLQKIKKIKTNFFTRKFGSMRSRKSDKQDDQISIQSNSSDNSRLSLTDVRNEFKKLKKLKKPKFRKTFANKLDEGIGMASILARSVIHAHTSLACIAETQDSEHSPSSTMRRTSESEPTINMSDEEKAKLESKIEAKNKEYIESIKKVPEIHTSLKNFNSDDGQQSSRVRKLSESCPATPLASRSENLLKLPGEMGYFGSLSLSGDSSEVYTSSEEEDDESSDQKTDNEKHYETTSSVVQSVLNNAVNPALIALMDRKLSILEGNIPIPKDVNKQQIIMEENSTTESEDDDSHKEQEKSVQKVVPPALSLDIEPNVQATSLKTSEPSLTASKSEHHHHLHFKFHNPFSHKKASNSLSAPCSPVENTSFMYRSSKRIRRQFSKLSKSNMIKSLSHYSLIPRKKHDDPKATVSNPGSATDLPSKAPSHETVLGSPFLSYADLLSLDKDPAELIKPLHKSDEIPQSKVKMYIGSEPVSRASLSGPTSPLYKDDHHAFDYKHHFHHPKEKSAIKPTGLVHTAMETILIDKVQSLMVPTSPDAAGTSKETQFFQDVNEKLERVEEARNKSNFEIERCTRSGSEIHKADDDSLSGCSRTSSKKKHKKEGLLQTAMETILIDKVQSLLPTTSPEPSQQRQFFGDHIIHNDGTHDMESKKHHVDEHKSNTHRESVKEGSLLQTAMQTMLMERVQSVIPTTATITPEIPHTGEKLLTEDSKHSSKSSITKSSSHHSLLHTAMETILFDKVQSLLPATAEPAYTDEHEAPKKFCDEQYKEKYRNSSKSSMTKSSSHHSLLHTAMETILFDKVQSLLQATAEPAYTDVHEAPKKFCEEQNKDGQESRNSSKSSMTKSSSHHSLLHTAMETILFDKVQSLLPATAEPAYTDVHEAPKNFCEEQNKDREESRNSSKSSMTKSSSHHSLLHTAMETNLFDKVQSLLPATAEPTHSEEHVETKKYSEEENKEEPLVQSAMQTMLLDKVQSLLIPAPVSPELSNESKNTFSHDKRERKLIRQNSVDSVRDSDESPLKMSKEDNPNIIIPCNLSQSQTKPVLQHFHPILSGAPLETIPSLPESSLDLGDSLDYGVDEKTSIPGCVSETNSASVCDNLHAACGFDRNERDRGDKERTEKTEKDIENEREKEREIEQERESEVEREKEHEPEREKDRGSPRHTRHESYGGREPLPATPQMQNASLNSTSTPMGIHRRSSDSDLSVTPKGGSLNTSGNAGSGGGAILRPSMNTNNLDMLEYPFLTMSEYPHGFIVHLGGTVCSRSVKLVDGGGESAARAAWWAELRTELRAHARALRCNAVIAYSESAAICEDVCVLSASGTAAVINLDCDFSTDGGETTMAGSLELKSGEELDCEVCAVAHVPYSPGTGPYRAELSTCGGCRRARVPAVLLATCAKPTKMQACTKAVTLTAVAARVRRAPPAAEPGARDISDQLPFLEYELHKLLLAKLRMQGANALFSLQTQIAIGERYVMALASGAALRLAALPPPTPPTIKASENDKDALEIQKSLWESFNANRALNGFDIGVLEPVHGPLPEPEGEEPPVLDLSSDKDACVLELDEAEDVETAKALALRRVHMQVLTNSVKPVPCVPPQAFAQVWRKRLVLSSQGTGASMAAERHVARALDGVTYKLRRLQPCALVAPRFQIELPEDEIQLVVSGTAIPLIDPNKPEHNGSDQSGVSCHSNHSNASSDLAATPPPAQADDDDIFTLDEEQQARQSQSDLGEEKNVIINGQVPTTVSLTSLSHMCGSRAARRICALRLLFVRETTAVRELGGLSGFLHTFTCEVLAIVRAYTAALGGNALTSFYITQLMLQDNAHKNQGQCLLSVGGDVVHITY